MWTILVLIKHKKLLEKIMTIRKQERASKFYKERNVCDLSIKLTKLS